ncbi:MAG: hypothetical protein GKS06_10730 [Acidobacteria bacterium]|nr:hypothetical protein [Acidobacteriota bacterium]
MGTRQIVPLVAVLLVQMACSSESTRAHSDWSMPVPAETPVHEFPHVSLEARTEHLMVERDLALAGALGVPFGRLGAVSLDDAGVLYVLDQAGHQVAVFGEEGKVRSVFGRAGGGPGELAYPHLVAVIGDRVFLHSRRLARLSVFDLQGNHVADHGMPGSFTPALMTGAGDGFLAVDAQEAMVTSEGPRPARWSVGLHSLDGKLVHKIFELERKPDAYWANPRGGGEIPVTAPDPRGAFSAGAVYVTDGRAYQVLALTPGGDPVWALRTDYTAPGPSEEFKRSVIGSDLPEYGPGWRVSSDPGSLFWPEHFATIENLEVDGSGNLYVFLHADRTREEWQEIHRPVPVDVYSPDGERLFTGLSPIDGWDAARGDYLYRIERDPATQEYVVARYRLQRPGD